MVNTGTLSVDGLNGYEIYRLKDSISDAAFLVWLMFIVIVYFPFFRLKIKVGRDISGKINMQAMLFGVNSYRKAFSVTGNIHSKYKTALCEDGRIFEEDNKHSDGAFSPYISYPEKPSNPVDRALQRIHDIKLLLLAGKSRYSKIDLDIKSSVSYLTEHTHLSDLFITAIVSVALSIAYCTATGLEYSIAGGLLVMSIVYQMGIINIRRDTNLKILSVVKNLEKQLIEIEQNQHKIDLAK